MFTTPGPDQKSLHSVQALRGIAAIMVVMFHAAAIWRESAMGAARFFGPWDQGYAGVDLFFVISGFIIVYVAGHRPAGLRTSARFMAARGLRIYPLWWIGCTLMALYFLLTYGVPASPDAGGGGSAWSRYALSMSLWPFGDLPVLSVGWTLTFEIGFYVLFGLMLISVPSRWRVPIMGVWAVIILVAGALADWEFQALPDGWTAWFVHPLCLEFIFGAVVAAYISQSQSKLFGTLLALSGGLALAGAFLVPHDVLSGQFPLYRVAAFGLPSAALLAGLVILERQSSLSVPTILKRLGDMSYSLYLFHFLILLGARRAFGLIGYSPGFWVFLILGTGLCVVGSYAAWRLIERPLHLASRRYLANKKSS